MTQTKRSGCEKLTLRWLFRIRTQHQVLQKAQKPAQFWNRTTHPKLLPIERRLRLFRNRTQLIDAKFIRIIWFPNLIRSQKGILFRKGLTDIENCPWEICRVGSLINGRGRIRLGRRSEEKEKKLVQEQIKAKDPSAKAEILSENASYCAWDQKDDNTGEKEEDQTRDRRKAEGTNVFQWWKQSNPYPKWKRGYYKKAVQVNY